LRIAGWLVTATIRSVLFPVPSPTFSHSSKNWGLLDYELQQIKDGLTDAAMLYRNIPVEYVASAAKPLALLQEAAKAKGTSPS